MQAATEVLPDCELVVVVPAGQAVQAAAPAAAAYVPAGQAEHEARPGAAAIKPGLHAEQPAALAPALVGTPE